MLRVRHAALVSLALASVLVPGAGSKASAQTDAAAPPIRSEMLGYYHGEQLSAYVIGGIGLAAAGAGVYLATRDGDFSRGLGWSFIALGGLEVVGAMAYALSVDSQIDHYDAALSRDAAAFREEEIAHIEGTLSRFVLYRAIELGLTVVGAAMIVYGHVSQRDVWTGAGVGIASLSLPVFLIDTINHARAEAYLDTLRGFAPAVSASPEGVYVSLSGSF